MKRRGHLYDAVNRPRDPRPPIPATPDAAQRYARVIASVRDNQHQRKDTVVTVNNPYVPLTLVALEIGEDATTWPADSMAP